MMAKSPVKGKYDTPVDAESAFEMLQKRTQDRERAGRHRARRAGAGRAAACSAGSAALLGGIFGTNRPRGQRLSTGQLMAREITRSVTNRVAGKVAGDLGKSLGGSVGGTDRPRHRARRARRNFAAVARWSL